MKYYIYIFCFTVFFSCKKKEDSSAWKPDITAPLITTDLSLKNLVKDSLIKENTDKSLTLNYRNTIYELDLTGNYLHIPDTAIGQKTTIDQMNLLKVELEKEASLGSIANAMIGSGDATQTIIGNLINSKNGQTSTISPINGLKPAPFIYDGSSHFQQMTVSSAILEFWLINKLPVDLTNIQYEIRNVTDNSLIYQASIPIIPAKDSVYSITTIYNKTINGPIAFAITNLNSPGSPITPVLIDTNDYIKLFGALRDIKVSEATAIFPKQDLIASNQEITLDIADRKFTYVDCRSGDLTVTLYNSIPEKLTLKYQLKGAYDKHGKPLILETIMPAGLPGNPAKVVNNFSLAGYSINLTGTDGTKFNTYTQVIKASIDSTGITRHITASDSIFIEYRLQNIKPNYIKGYAGKDTVSVLGNSPFSFANLFNGSAPNALQFKQISLNMNIENGFGLAGNVKISNLSGTNANGNIVSLQDNSPNPLLGNTIAINSATDFPYTPSVQNFNMNSANSNINQFVSNLPNKINYDIKVQTNPQGNLGTYDNFAYLESRLKVNMDLSMPLSVLANNLLLRDSINFLLGNNTTLNNIQSGNLYLIAYNKFPIEPEITFIAYDENWQLLDTVVQAQKVLAADLNTNCRADSEKKSMLTIQLDEARIAKIKKAKHAVILANFNTRSNQPVCNGQYLKIYSDYHLKATVSAQFIYKIKP